MSMQVGELYAKLGLVWEDFKKGLAESETVGTSWAKGMGTKLIGAMGVAGVGAAIGKGIMDAMAQEVGVDKAAARLGLNEGESARLGKIAGDVYAGAFGDSVEENADVLADVWKKFGDLGDEALQEITEGAITVADVFDQDVNRVIAAAQQAFVNGLAPDAQSALDLVAGALRGTKGDTDEVVEALIEYSTNFGQLGLEGPQVLAALTSEWTTNQYAIDKVGDSIKEMFIRLGDKSATDALATLGLDIEKVNAAFAEGGPAAQDALNQIITALEGVQDPLEQTRLGAEIMGAPYEDLGANALPILRDLAEGVTEVGDVTGEMAEQVGDNAATSWEQLWRTIKGEFIEGAGDELLPTISTLVETLLELSDTVLPAVEEAMNIAGSAARGATFIVDGLAEAFGQSDGRAADMARASQYLANALLDGKQPAASLANALLDMARTGELTADEFETLARQSGLTDAELAAVRQTLMDYARTGEDAEVTTEELAEAFGIADRAAQAETDRLSAMADAMGDTEDATQDLAGAQDDLEGETDAATDALREQFDLMRSELDPVFALRDAADQAAEAQRAITEAAEEHGRGSEEHRQAIQDAAEANLALRDAELAVQEASKLTRDEFVQQQVELGLTKADAELLADSFEELDGFQFESKTLDIITRYTERGKRPPTSAMTGLIPGRASGGPVSAHGIFEVGEGNRPELFQAADGSLYMIPGHRGRVIPMGDINRMLASAEMMVQGAARSSQGALRSAAFPGGGNTTHQENHVHMEGTGIPEVDAQRVGATMSVLRRMETI